MAGLRVERSGPRSLLQDAGRPSWQHLGVSPSGPLDRQAAAWANRLLGNPWDAALLEVALGGLQVTAEVDTWVAVCGADLPIAVDGAPRPNWSRFALRAGQCLTLGFARAGQLAYLAVAGGFRVEGMLGSVATQCREGLGGPDGRGRALRAGDRLPCVPARLSGAASVPWRFVPDYRQAPVLRLIPGGDFECFALEERQRFFSQGWQLSPRSDRMGARLAGEGLRPPARQWSLPVTTGAVQVPPDGQPIILLADRQTMGGYPLLGWLDPRDAWRLAQCPPHQVLRFVEGDLDRARAGLRRLLRFFR